MLKAKDTIHKAKNSLWRSTTPGAGLLFAFNNCRLAQAFTFLILT